jgi:hypothetical protein
MGAVKEYAPAVARGLVGAGAGMADLATTMPYNAVQEIGHMLRPDKPARDLPSISDAAQKGLTQMGLPEAETTGQKVAQYGTEILAGGGASALKGVAKGILAPSAAKQDLILGALHDAATKTIEQVKNSGVKFKPAPIKQLLQDLESHPDLGTEGEKAVRAETAKTVDDLKASVQDKLDKSGNIIGPADTSLRNLIGFRDKLTTLVSKGGQEGNAALKAQKLLDKTLDRIPEFKKFQKQWGIHKTGQEVQAAMNLADVSPAKSRAAFQKIVDSDYFKSFDPKVQGLIKTAAKGKASGKFMEVLGILKQQTKLGKAGKILPGAEVLGAAALGHPGIAAGVAGSLVAGKGGELVQRGLGADVLKYLQDSQ